MMLEPQNDHILKHRLGLSSREILEFCQRWGIKKMAVFGSILRNDFQDESDIDLLIYFAPNVRQGLLTLARIKRELEIHLSRPVDLVLEESLKMSDNWIRKNEILSTAQTIYEQR
jgi:predicted nucleotidyltransferase